jgi:spermidine/putrescine-binding protein
MSERFGRRDFLKAGGAAGALALLPRRAAAAEPLVVATFPGTWNEAHRDVLAPYFRKKTGADVTQTILLATDEVAKLEAARGKPPFDVAIMDEGPLLDAVKAGVIEKYPVDKSPNYKDLVPAFQDPWGPKISLQVIGIGFNPKKIKERPKSWNDLFNPAYKGRVGLTALNSTLGMAFMVDLAKTRGGSESDIEPAFKALKELLPNVGARSRPTSAPTRRCSSRSRSTSRLIISTSCRRSKRKASTSILRRLTLAFPLGAPACISSKTQCSRTSRCNTSTRISRPRCRKTWSVRRTG